MRRVLIAMIPGTAAMVICFGIGVLVNLLVALLAALATEAVLLRTQYPTLAWKFSLRILGLSQIGKYLPGNVAHVAGRAVLARPLVQPLDITYSFVVESLLLVASHAAIGVLQLGYIVGLTTMQAAAGSLILIFTCPLGLVVIVRWITCLLYTSPSPRDLSTSRMPSSA